MFPLKDERLTKEDEILLNVRLQTRACEMKN